MPDDLKKVKAGDKLRIPARTFNTFIDMALDWRRGRLNAGRDGKGAGIPGCSMVRVVNECGSNLPMFSVLAINGPATNPNADEDVFKIAASGGPLRDGGAVLHGDEPSLPDDAGKFVILLEPVEAGGVAWACASGVCAVQIDLNGGDDPKPEYADVEDGETSYLKIADPGPGAAQILWYDDSQSSGLVWALVRMGNPGPRVPKFCKVTGIYKTDDKDWKAANPWVWPDYITGNPCNSDGSEVKTEETVDVCVTGHADDITGFPSLAVDDVIAWLPYDQKLGGTTVMYDGQIVAMLGQDGKSVGIRPPDNPGGDYYLAWDHTFTGGTKNQKIVWKVLPDTGGGTQDDSDDYDQGDQGASTAPTGSAAGRRGAAGMYIDVNGDNGDPKTLTFQHVNNAPTDGSNGVDITDELSQVIGSDTPTPHIRVFDKTVHRDSAKHLQGIDDATQSYYTLNGIPDPANEAGKVLVSDGTTCNWMDPTTGAATTSMVWVIQPTTANANFDTEIVAWDTSGLGAHVVASPMSSDPAAQNSKVVDLASIPGGAVKPATGTTVQIAPVTGYWGFEGIHAWIVEDSNGHLRIKGVGASDNRKKFMLRIMLIGPRVTDATTPTPVS